MPFILYDLFPAQVTITPSDPDSGELLEKQSFIVEASRVVVTESAILVVIDSPTGPVMVFNLPYAAPNFTKTDTPYGTSTLMTSLGHWITFRKDDSCGCGSRLRSWNPYSHIVARG